MGRAKVAKTSRQIHELKKFCAIHDLVAFGELYAHDEILPVRGITLQRKYRDRFYAHGNTRMRELTLLGRDFFVGLNKNKHSWVIMNTKLEVNDLPHVFIDASRSDHELYKDLVSILGKLTYANDVIKNKNISFASEFHVFSQLQTSFLLEHYIHTYVMQKLYDHYQGLSFEFERNQLFVYSELTSTSLKILNAMLEALLFLSEELEYLDAQYHGHKE